MNRWGSLVLLAILAIALVLRVSQLASRPLHNDEAVNAVKVSELWQQGRYVYDPDEYHGPTLHYATLPFLWLSGARSPGELHDATLRIAPVVFGIGLILLLLPMADGLGRPALFWAAIFTAVSPAMVFYSRYFIHEILLVFFTGLTICAGWRYSQSRSSRWALVAGIGLGLMATTKETFVISLAAMGLAGIATIWGTLPAKGRWQGLRALWNWKHAAVSLSAAFAIWLLLFSSFFTNAGGLIDSVLTYLPWLKRAGGHSPHIHPWNFYLERLVWFHPAKSPVWSEALILALAVIGAVASFARGRHPLHRFLTLYTIILTAAYCVISYKTPWCLLGFYHGMIILAGLGAATLVGTFRSRAPKITAMAVIGLLTVQLSWQAWRASIVYPADPLNPYVYAQTAPDLLPLMERIEGITRIAPTGSGTVVKIIIPENDYWPMPWYLRRLHNLGWFDQLPNDPYAPIIVVSSTFDARLDDKSDRKWIMAGISTLRPGTFLELYVELELWKRYVATLPRDRD